MATSFSVMARTRCRLAYGIEAQRGSTGQFVATAESGAMYAEEAEIVFAITAQDL